MVSSATGWSSTTASRGSPDGAGQSAAPGVQQSPTREGSWPSPGSQAGSRSDARRMGEGRRLPVLGVESVYVWPVLDWGQMVVGMGGRQLLQDNLPAGRS